MKEGQRTCYPLSPRSIVCLHRLSYVPIFCLHRPLRSSPLNLTWIPTSLKESIAEEHWLGNIRGYMEGNKTTLPLLHCLYCTLASDHSISLGYILFERVKGGRALVRQYTREHTKEGQQGYRYTLPPSTFLCLYRLSPASAALRSRPLDLIWNGSRAGTHEH